MAFALKSEDKNVLNIRENSEKFVDFHTSTARRQSKQSCSDPQSAPFQTVKERTVPKCRAAEYVPTPKQCSGEIQAHVINFFNLLEII
jgi:hypothetical protein